MAEPRPWHTIEIEEVFSLLDSGPQGLEEAEAQKRLAQVGPNALQEAQGPSPWGLFLSQFKSFLIIILLIAVLLSALLGEVVDAALIFAIVLFAAGLGFIQEHRAERALEALRRMTTPTATVLRQGEEKEIPSPEVVPGDVVLLSTGDRVPADCRLVETVNLKVDEASLTGESVPVEKTREPLSNFTLPVADRWNIAYMGTSVVYGRGRGVVVATGMATQFGQIAKMLGEVEAPKTPLQVSLDRMGRWIAQLALGLAVLFFIVGLARGHGLFEMFLWAVSLAVAVIPEALPAVVTISLALGVHKLARRNALMRRLPAVETLGSTSVICSDKTGTLTQDQMTVRKLYVNGQVVEVSGVGYEPVGAFSLQGQPLSPEEPHLKLLLQIAALCNDAQLIRSNGSWRIKGDPTEAALAVAAAKAGLDQGVRNELPRLGEFPFSSESKRMTTLHPAPGGRVAYAKGAPEVILEACSHIYHQGQEFLLAAEEREVILGVNSRLAGEALRVLGLAYKRLPLVPAHGEEVERGMVFVGLAAMIDPPRQEVKEAIEKCRGAGIRPVMITGDHKLTATAIARELGLQQGGMALTGSELEEMSQEELESIVDKVEVYARVSPAHKLKIVEAWAKKGSIVAMTGDGVNDAPALKRADIGVAMGITGTDVSKEAADMVLADDNFATIVSAVELGRGVYDNVKKYLLYLLGANIGEVLLMLITALAGLPLPLIAIQLLYVNLATDGLPALALSVEPPEKDIMARPPRPPRQSVFTPVQLRFLVGAGLWTGLVCLGVYLWALNSGRELTEVQSMTFVTLILLEFFQAFNCRSVDKSVFEIGLFTNRWLWLAVLWEALIPLQIVVYAPFLQDYFHTHSLSLVDWAVAVGAASTIFILAEIVKRFTPYLKS